MIEQETVLPKAQTISLSDRQKKLLQRLGLVVLGLLLVAAVAATAALLWLRSATRAALPVLDGAVHVAGLQAEVTVERDAHGVPHLAAATQNDLWLAQGFVTAQDRLWQMDALRRNSNGELAELMGSSFVEHDRAQRILGIRKTAERLYAATPAEERLRLDAYARGVNLFIAQHGDSLPPEFRLLRYRPRPWTGIDSIAVGLTMAQMLDSRWPTKIARERVEELLKHDEKLVGALYPVGSWRDHPPTGLQVDWSLPRPARPEIRDEDEEDDERSDARLGVSGQDLMELQAALGLPTCSGCSPGSNNWVVSGQHTASGKPLLANDMHLALTLPGVWYMADLRAPGFHAAGVTLPGMPYIVAGHNEHVAWGFTALFADVQDLYVEKLDGKGNFEDNDAQWKPLAVDHEVIKVRGGKDVVVDVQTTAHGPIITPLLKNETRPIALKWTLYDPALGMPPVYKMNTTASAAEFSALMSQWSYPTQNVVFADDQGHIGYRAIGKIPARTVSTVVPIAHGSHEPRYEWLDSTNAYISFEELPQAFDPPSGFLATANARVTTDSAPHLLSHDWASPYRVERIYKALQGRDGLTAADMLATQIDVYSEVNQELGHRFAYAIDHADKTDNRLRQAANLMRVWDGRLTVDSAAASVVTQTRMALWKLLLEPKLGNDAEVYRWAESEFAQEEIVMHAKPEWLPHEYKNWDELLTEAVRRGMKAGKAPGDVNQWAYGGWHVVEIAHPLAAYLPLVGRIAGTGKQPLAGDTTTVKQSTRTFGPSQRFVMDWNSVDGSMENLPVGQSGNPLSPYFADQWPDYSAGKSFALPFSPAAVTAAKRHTLKLEP